MLGKYTTKVLSGVLGAYLSLAGSAYSAVAPGTGNTDTTNVNVKPNLESCVNDCKKKPIAPEVAKEIQNLQRRGDKLPLSVGSYEAPESTGTANVPATPAAKPTGKPKLVAIPIYCPSKEKYSGIVMSYKVTKKDSRGIFGIADGLYAKNKRQIFQTPDFNGKKQWRYDFVCDVKELNGLDKRGTIKVDQKIKIPYSWLGNKSAKPAEAEKPIMTLAERLEMVDERRKRESFIGELGMESILGESFTHLGVGWHRNNGRSYMISGAVNNKNTGSERVAYEFAATAPHPITELYKEVTRDVNVNTNVDGSIHFTTGWDLGRYFTALAGVGAQFIKDTFNVSQTNQTKKNGAVLDQETRKTVGVDNTVRGILSAGGQMSFGWMNPRLTDLYLNGSLGIPLPTSTNFNGYEHKFDSGLNGASGRIGLSYRFARLNSKKVKKSEPRVKAKKMPGFHRKR